MRISTYEQKQLVIQLRTNCFCSNIPFSCIYLTDYEKEGGGNE